MPHASPPSPGDPADHSGTAPAAPASDDPSDALPLPLPPMSFGYSTDHLTGGQVKRVLDVSRVLATTTELDPLLARIAEATTTLLECERASIFLHDPNADELWTKVALQTERIRRPAGAGVVGHAFRTNQTVHVSDPYADPRFNAAIDQSRGFRTRSLLTAPMVDHDQQPVGVIEAINKRAGDFDADDKALIRLLADEAGAAVERYRLYTAAMEIVVLRKEMDLARQVQQAQVPRAAPPVPSLDAAGWMRCASSTGGDCFDLWELPDGRLGLFIADASGHGLASALVVSQARSLVRALSRVDCTMTPHQVLEHVDHRLAEDLSPGWFVTAFLGYLSSEGRLEWSSGGHGPIFFRPAADAPARELETPAPLLGIGIDFSRFPAPGPLQLHPTGSVVSISDGIYEAPDAADEQFGPANLAGVLDATRARPACEVVDAIRDAADRWSPRPDPRDDQTILVARRV